MATHKKPAPHVKKTVPKKPVKHATKKSVSAPAKKPASAKKPAPTKKPALEKKPAPAKKPAPHPAPTKKSAVPLKPKDTVPSNNNKKPSKKDDARERLRSRILGTKKATKPIAFSLDEVREIAKTIAKTSPETSESKPVKTTAKSAALAAAAPKGSRPPIPNHIKPASLADILGFNPKKSQKPTTDLDPEKVPEKYRRYYRMLLDLRSHLTEGIALHSEETLKRSSKDDAGDLSSYGQHMADAGTDTFDRDFALSLVSSEQDALTEIDAAIKRVHSGTYGICEVTGKPIAKERLTAVPFTRFSAEAQKDIERNRMRTRASAGLFGELGEDGAKIEERGDDE